MAATKEEFVEIIKKIREVIASDKCTECSCPNVRCELHGDCYNCVRVYRHFGHHVPRCLQFVLDKKIETITQTMEKEMGKRPKTPDEHYDYLNTVMPKTDIYRDRKEPHGSPLPHHRTYGSVYGDSADQNRPQIQGNEIPRDLK